MRQRDQNTLNVMRRCRALVARHLDGIDAEDVPGRTVLDDVLARVDQLIAEHRSASDAERAERGQQALLESVLRRQHLNPLINALRHGGRVPESELSLDPRPCGGTRLVAAARRIVARGRGWQKQLVEEGFAPTVLSDVLAVARALENSIAAEARHHETRVTAGPSIEAALARGRHALDALESVIRLRFASQPAVVAAWRAARGQPGSAPPEPVRDDASPTREVICVP